MFIHNLKGNISWSLKFKGIGGIVTSAFSRRRANSAEGGYQRAV
jgi:hypothetical protein